MSSEVLALVNYYARTGYYRQVQTVCNEALKKRGGNDPTLVFWRALGILKEGSVNEAIREYEALASRNDAQLALPVKLALLHAHQLSKVVDSEEVARLHDEVEREDANAPDKARMSAALLLWHLGERNGARRQASWLINSGQPAPALALMGWLDLDDALSDGCLDSEDEFRLLAQV